MCTEETIKGKYLRFSPFLDERTLRHWAANEAIALGYGGISTVSRATSLSPNTIKKGISEIDTDEPLDANRVRSYGGGRKSSLEHSPDIQVALENLVDPMTRGDPGSSLRWTCKSLRNLSSERKRSRANCRAPQLYTGDLHADLS
ncbi:MAG: hypothetical protein LBJ61_12840 [Deltaproteobacteria bacterium]|jgi:hypothetical protein|nr:hypothetical protein [Deltaproteobacteria bacterium]